MILPPRAVATAHPGDPGLEKSANTSSTAAPLLSCASVAEPKIVVATITVSSKTMRLYSRKFIRLTPPLEPDGVYSRFLERATAALALPRLDFLCYIFSHAYCHHPRRQPFARSMRAQFHCPTADRSRKSTIAAPGV